jgi:hypothetical protein
MDIKEQQKIAKEMLKKIVNKFDPYAVIAGGAPRNWKMDKKAKDVDIYFRCLMYGGAESFIKNNLKGIELKETGTRYSTNRHEISTVLEGTYKCVEFDLIVMAPECTSPYDRISDYVMNQFDVGISQICIEVSNCLDTKQLEFRTRTTDKFRKDFHNKTLTFSGNKTRIEEYKPKLMKYFPDFKVIDKS